MLGGNPLIIFDLAGYEADNHNFKGKNKEYTEHIFSQEPFALVGAHHLLDFMS